jgi:hypothetical protein
MVFWPRPCTYRAFIRSVHLLDHDRAHWFGSHWSHFTSPAVNLFQGFALHLQLHLGVFLEDLRVSLAQHLSHPLIRHSCATASTAGSMVRPCRSTVFSRKRDAPPRADFIGDPFLFRAHFGWWTGARGVLLLSNLSTCSLVGVHSECTPNSEFRGEIVAKSFIKNLRRPSCAAYALCELYQATH